jgi:hypothetical protein
MRDKILTWENFSNNEMKKTAWPFHRCCRGSWQHLRLRESIKSRSVSRPLCKTQPRLVVIGTICKCKKSPLWSPHYKHMKAGTQPLKPSTCPHGGQHSATEAIHLSTQSMYVSKDDAWRGWQRLNIDIIWSRRPKSGVSPSARKTWETQPQSH